MVFTNIIYSINNNIGFLRTAENVELRWIWVCGLTNLGSHNWSAWGRPTVHSGRWGSYSLHWERSPHHRRTQSQCHGKVFYREMGGRYSLHSRVWRGADMLMWKKTTFHKKPLPHKCKSTKDRKSYHHCEYSEEGQWTSVLAWCRWGYWVHLPCNQGHSCTSILCPQGTSPCCSVWGLPSCSGPCMASSILWREDQSRHISVNLLLSRVKPPNILNISQRNHPLYQHRINNSAKS